jgi:uncharacterized protein involved in type VI secretion and phage assembly
VSRGGPVTVDVENVVARLADAVEHRFFGKYRALVVDNDDPERLGRLKVSVPSLLGDQVVTGWAVPCVPYGGGTDRGMLFVPEVGDGVWVEFEEGDLEFPIWVGTFWSKPGGEPETPRPNDQDGAEASETQTPPTRKIIKTFAGHTIQFEDASGGVRILVADGQNENRIAFASDGLTITSKGDVVTLADDGITIEDSHGNTITMSQTSGALGGPGISVNGGTRACLEGLIPWLISHTHVGAPSGMLPVNPANIAELAPLAASSAAGILSQKVTIE